MADMHRLSSRADAAKEVVAGHIRTLQQYQPSNGGTAADESLGEDSGARRVGMHAGCTALRLLQVSVNCLLADRATPEQLILQLCRSGHGAGLTTGQTHAEPAMLL